MPTVDHGPLGQVRTVELTLSEPSDGLVLGGRTTSTVTITPHGDLPDVGGVTVLDDYESGVPAGYTTWGISAPVTPVLSHGTAWTAGGNGLIATVGGSAGRGRLVRLHARHRAPPTGPRTTASRSGSWAPAAAGCSGTS